jgi:hypothetical protein
VSEVHPISITAAGTATKPSLGDVNLSVLASAADALSANGRPDLAAYVVEVLYYCGERRLRVDNVVAFSQRRPDRQIRAG